MMVDQLPRRLVCGLIRIYQKTLSPDHGWMRIFFPHGACKFHPTCSLYGSEAVARYGVIKGSPLLIRRILRCHPWSPGGYDPVIDQLPACKRK